MPNRRHRFLPLTLLLLSGFVGCTNMLDLQDGVVVGTADAAMPCPEGQCPPPQSASCADDTQCAPGQSCVAQVCTVLSGGQPMATTAPPGDPDPVPDSSMPMQTVPDAGGPVVAPEAVPKTCADITCSANADCVTVASGAVCKCMGGFVDPDGSGTCVDKCSLAGCAAMATCTIDPSGEAQCACPPDYIGDGQTCEFDANCQLLDCGPNTECVAEGTQRVCQCLAGFGEAAGGGCQDIDECALGTAGCGPNQDCTNTPGGAECTCREDPACESGTALACDGDSEYRCAQDENGCLVPEPATPCRAENECQTAGCARVVGCSSSPKRLGTRCSAGVCNLPGDCVDCITDSHCGVNEYCSLLGNCRRTVCGDGVVSGAETCDTLLTSEWECSRECQAQTLYTECESASDCINGFCTKSPDSARFMCAPAAGSGPPSQHCPPVPRRTVKYLNARYCVIECATASDCPSQLSRCAPNAHATESPPPSSYEATRYCEP